MRDVFLSFGGKAHNPRWCICHQKIHQLCGREYELYILIHLLKKFPFYRT
jgi:hypothetical protein